MYTSSQCSSIQHRMRWKALHDSAPVLNALGPYLHRLNRAAPWGSCLPTLMHNSTASHTPRSSEYDHPALYSNDDAFSERSYWDRRYQQEPGSFEWYRGYKSLAPLLRQHLPPSQPVLHLGVGTSHIQADMVLMDGYSRVVNVDYSPVCIQQLAQLHQAIPQLEYAVADVRCMPQYEDCSFGGILDKGTLDALLCGDSDTADSAAMLTECYRLLAPGAAYLMVTSASPRARLPYLRAGGGDAAAAGGSSSSSSSSSGGAGGAVGVFPWQRVLVYEVGQQGAQAGPFDWEDGEALAQLPGFGYSHFVYVCVKAGAA